MEVSRIPMGGTPMCNALGTVRITRGLAAMFLAGLMSVLVSAPAGAEDKLQPPPYQMTGASGVGLNVVWDDQRPLIPSGESNPSISTYR
jgi:hypothetical protein